jgi:anti-sigma regulatory factor (Ser/Thr protein kinase)
VPFDQATLVDIRTDVAAILQRCGLPAPVLDGFVLAVNEVATNAVLYGGQARHLRLWCDGRRLYSEISDDGDGLPPGLVLGPVPPLADGGRGLWLASQLSRLAMNPDRSDGATVELSLSCPRSVHPAGPAAPAGPPPP